MPSTSWTEEYELLVLEGSVPQLGTDIEAARMAVAAWRAEPGTDLDEALWSLVQRDYARAVQLLEPSAGEATQEPLRLLLLGSALVALGSEQPLEFGAATSRRALEPLLEAERLTPDDPVVATCLGFAYLQLYRFDEYKSADTLFSSKAFFERALTALEEAGDRAGILDGILNLSLVIEMLADGPANYEPEAARRRKTELQSRLLQLLEPEREPRVRLVDSYGWALRYNFGPAVIPFLPLEGVRSFDQLALLAPGVSRVPFSSGRGPAVGVGVGTAGQFSVNGQRGRSNNFTIDGSDNNDEDIGVRRQGFVAIAPQAIDSVLELQVITAGVAAQYGRNSGSVVNVISRRGQTQFQGSLFGIFGDDFANARNFHETPFVDRINPGDRNGGDFHRSFTEVHEGGTAGGRLGDKTFFFASAEQHRLRRNAIRHFVLPVERDRGLRGLIDGSFMVTPVSQLDTLFQAHHYRGVVGREIYGLIPLPNNPSGPFGENTFSQVRRQFETGTVATGQLEHYFNADQTLTGRYNFTDDRSAIPFTGEALNSSLGTSTRTQNLSLYLNSRWAANTNLARFSYGRTALEFPPEVGDRLLFGSEPTVEFLEAASTLMGLHVPLDEIVTNYGRFGPFGATGPIGQLWIDPFSPIGVDVYNFPQGRVDNTFQFADSLAMSFGGHLLKYGIDVRRSQLNSFADRLARPLVRFGYGLLDYNCRRVLNCRFATPDGLLTGSDLAALGAPAGFLQAIGTGPTPDTTIGLRLTEWDLFVQDEWRLAPNLNIDLGLRWEYQTPPQEQNRRIENAFSASPDQFGHQADGTATNLRLNRAFDEAFAGWLDFLGGRTRIYRPFRLGFAPRVGFAWDPLGRGDFVVRAGFALLNDANLGAVTSQSRNVFPTFVPVNLDPAFRRPNGVVLNNPIFFTFSPTSEPLIQPGTLNTYGLGSDAFATGLGTLFVQSEPLPNRRSSNGLAFTLPEDRFRPSYSLQTALSVQKQFGRHLVLSASYVGAQARRLTGFGTPNAGLLSTPFLTLTAGSAGPVFVTSFPPSIPPAGQLRPDSRLGAYTVFRNSLNSSYHALQLFLQNRGWKGLQAQVQWTWSKAIDQLSDPFDSRGAFALPQDSLRDDLERAPASFDVRHRVTGYFTWETPEGGNRSISRFLRRWRFSGIVEFQTGQPFTVNSAIDRNGDGNLTDRLDTLEGVRVDPDSALAVDLAGTDRLDLVAPRNQNGRVGRNTFRADGLALVNLAVSKTVSLPKGQSLQFRIEVFNALNSVNYGIPIRILESPGFGRVYDSQAEARSTRFAINWTF